LSEPISVIYNAIEAFERAMITSRDKIAVWGDGSIGFIAALVLKNKYPDSKICVIGKNKKKLQNFSFADDVYLFSELPENIMFNHSFECVRGKASEAVIDKIIDTIQPQGIISLIGVSEEPVPINTRMVLEKGIHLIGNSRSERADFEKAVKLISENEFAREQLKKVVSNEFEIKNINDIYNAFEKDKTSDFKTIMKWDI